VPDGSFESAATFQWGTGLLEAAVVVAVAATGASLVAGGFSPTEGFSNGEGAPSTFVGFGLSTPGEWLCGSGILTCVVSMAPENDSLFWA